MTDWVGICLTALCGLLVWLIQQVYQDNRQANRSRKLLLRAEIRELHHEYMAAGEVPVNEAGEFRELVEMYEKLGGNGTAKLMADDVLRLPRKGG